MPNAPRNLRAIYRNALAVVATALVGLLVFRGDNHNLHWVYPLLVILPLLLSHTLAIVCGLLVGAVALPLVWMRFDIGAALVVCASMVLTWLISASLMHTVARQSRKLGELATTDPLTGALNRRRLQADTEEAMQIVQRYQRPSSLLLLDVDNFKRINDELGHDAGDRALCELARVLRRRLRSLDSVYRYGGDEFAVLLVETEASQAAHVAEELRAHVQAANIVPQRQVTVSVGVCDVRTENTAARWLKKCDKALYRAKYAGRNRVEQAP